MLTIYIASVTSTPTDGDTYVFDLRIKCDRRLDAAPGETDPRKLYHDANVYTGMIKWVPQGNQEVKVGVNKPRPVDEDILLVKLRPGQVGCSFVETRFAEGNAVDVRISISIARRKMRRKCADMQQILDLHCFARKGVGADHAKFSPVGKSLT